MGRGRGIIVGRKCPKIQNCPTCGRMRVYHPDGFYKCPIPNDVTAAINAYRLTHGKAWMAKLVAAWATGESLGELQQQLQHARNAIGPRRLYNLKF